MSSVVVSALYNFVTLENFEEIKAPLLKLMLDIDLLGTLFLAKVGINGTVAGSQH